VFVGLFVCLSIFPHDISKTDAARITELDVAMVHHDFCNLVYFGVKKSRSRSKKLPALVLHSCECWLFPVTSMISYRPNVVMWIQWLVRINSTLMYDVLKHI